MKTKNNIYLILVAAFIFLIPATSYSQSFNSGGFQGGGHGSGGVLSNIDEIPILFEEFRITVYPNPFSEYTQLKIELKQSSKLKLEIFDLSGRIVNTIHNLESFNSGTYTFKWKGSNNQTIEVPKGIYYCRIEINEKATIKKLIKY